MDIVSRLKQYIDFRNLGSTQFADMCLIPRPTVSQLLNGRNKKISDEIISKIHFAFPDLSVSWLLFGEGTMVADSQSEISEPKNHDNGEMHASQLGNIQPFKSDVTKKFPVQDLSSDNFQSSESTQLSFNDFPHSIVEPAKDAKLDDASDISHKTPQAYEDNEKTNLKNDIAIKPPVSKNIARIVILYDDSTFETYIPF